MLHQSSAYTLLPCCTLDRCTSRTPETARPDGCAGPAGNGLAERVAAKIRSISTDANGGLEIPPHGWGLWPKSAKRPVPFRPEEAKVPFPYPTPLTPKARAPLCALKQINLRFRVLPRATPS